jgi:hypothetical protein
MFFKYNMQSYDVLIYFSSSHTVNGPCRNALKVHLNDESNLKMVTVAVNQKASFFSLPFS